MDRRLERLIFICFFLSGMNALVYESAWLNRIQLVTGHTIYSLATTLASYMSGLALGALFAPKLRRTGISPLLLYLVAELLIGLYGIVFYPLLKWIQIPYQLILAKGAFGLPALSFFAVFVLWSNDPHSHVSHGHNSSVDSAFSLLKKR